MDLQPILIRTQVIKSIRRFFEQKRFTEVITPVFNTGLPLEPNIYAFETSRKIQNEKTDIYLTTSPESAIKKMLAAGFGNSYSIGKCFRNLEGSSTRHNPEFLMLEWYRVDATYHQVMQDVQELIIDIKRWCDSFENIPHTTNITYQNIQFDLARDWPTLSLVNLFQQYLNIDLQTILDEKAMNTFAESKGYQTSDAEWGQLFEQLFLNEIEPHLPTSPFFLIDFPIRVSPLCNPKSDQPYLAERFELYMAGMEIANGNTENLDSHAVHHSFQTEAEKRSTLDQKSPHIDNQFIEAIKTLEKTQRSYAGVGMGIERLAMIMANVDNIKQVEPFTIA